ncbi:TetR/AcrR family transcriptional regulator [Streptomyces sp. NPDC048650]|uniref:TetR/AcrR family transcriptional regulator n=1 Tax=Streptomyces sp. NPDC048650 TaxID=3365583 RepID=UPI003715ACA2
MQQRHGTARPGGRTAQVRQAVLDAASELLEGHGFGKLSLDLIARQSGVHETTLRRRWRTVEGIVADLLELHKSTLPAPDTGSFREDLHALARVILKFLDSQRNRHLVEGMVAAAARDPSLAEAIGDTYTARIEQVTELVNRAMERGELGPDTDAAAVIAALSAPFYYRLLITHRPLDDEVAHFSAEAAYHAAMAGAFSVPGAETPVAG